MGCPGEEESLKQLIPRFLHVITLKRASVGEVPRTHRVVKDVVRATWCREWAVGTSSNYSVMIVQVVIVKFEKSTIWVEQLKECTFTAKYGKM